MRVSQGAEKSVQTGAGEGYIHKLGSRPRDGYPDRVQVKPATARNRLSPTKVGDIQRGMIAYGRSLGAESMQKLADEWRIPVDVLHRLGVGFGECCGRWSWTFVERNGFGLPVGISRRLAMPLPDGTTKLQAPGSRRGLFFDPAILQQAAPATRGVNSSLHQRGACCQDVYVVEGASDVCVMEAMGLFSIARPSNSGGVGYLRDLFRHIGLAAEQRVIVVGEWDPKPVHPVHGHRFPGRDGARGVAEQLASMLNRIISWAMVPDRKKDVRDWAASRCAGDRQVDLTMGVCWSAGIDRTIKHCSPGYGRRRRRHDVR